MSRDYQSNSAQIRFLNKNPFPSALSRTSDADFFKVRVIQLKQSGLFASLLVTDKKKRETKMNVHKKDSLVAPEPDDKTAEVAAFATYHSL
jgi:hypothetical protein